MVFSRRESNTQLVASLDARAEALNLRVGLGIAEARAMHPSIEIIEAEPEADQRLLESLADWCDRYTPLVAIDGTDGLFLDITGCAHLFGGERAMLDEVVTRFQGQGFDARGGLASTPGAAWAAARYSHGKIIDPGEEQHFFAPLPLSALRLDTRIGANLESVGLRVAGALISAPRAPLVRRFGKTVTLRLDQALGHIAEPISPRLPMPALSVERIFFNAITQLDDIENLVGTLAVQLKRELERRAEGAERLQLQLFRVDGDVVRITVAASRPLREPKLIRRLFREKLAGIASNIDAGYGFDQVRLAAFSTAPLAPQQVSLGEDLDPEGDLAQFADRVHARLGEAALLMPRLVESHVPERAAPPVPFVLEPAKASLSSPALRERPIRLLDHAELVEVVAAEIPEGPPSRFRWRQVSYRVTRAEGPERIAPEWWDNADGIGTRDYFRVEDEGGRRYWLYREGFYGAETPPHWFIQGFFA